MLNFNQSVYKAPCSFLKDIDNSYFDVLECLLESEDAYFKIQKDRMVAMHYGIVSESYEIIEEGLKDFFTSIGNFFKKIFKAIGDFFARFFKSISSYITDFNKFIKKNREYLSELNPDFKIKGFNYTIKDGYPKLTNVEKIITEFNKKATHLEDITMKEINEEKSTFDKDVFLANLRKDVIGSTNAIGREDYSDEIFKINRDGEKEEIEIYVTKERLQQAIDGYENLSMQFKEVKELQNRTNRLFADMKNFFEKGARIHYEGDSKKITSSQLDFDTDKLSVSKKEGETITSNADRIGIVNKFYSEKFYETKVLCNIVSLAVTGKVEAIKSYMKQERKIIRGSMSTKAIPKKDIPGEETKEETASKAEESFNVEDYEMQLAMESLWGKTKNTFLVIQNMSKKPFKTNDWEPLRKNLLKMVNNLDSIEDLDYYLKDLYTGKKQLSTLADNLTKERKKPNPKIHSTYKNTDVKALREHIKWLDTVYKPAIQKRKREIKEASKK